MNLCTAPSARELPAEGFVSERERRASIQLCWAPGACIARPRGRSGTRGLAWRKETIGFDINMKFTSCRARDGQGKRSSCRISSTRLQLRRIEKGLP